MTSKTKADRRRIDAVERHHRSYNLVPQGRFTRDGVDYVVAVGGPFFIHVPTTEVEHLIKKEHPHGYYEVAFTLLRDDVPWIGGSNLIDKNHDLDQTDAARHRARVNAGREMAMWAIDNGAKAAVEAER